MNFKHFYQPGTFNMQKVNSDQHFYYRAQANYGEQQVFGIKSLRRKLEDDSLAETDTHYPSTISLLTF